MLLYKANKGTFAIWAEAGSRMRCESSETESSLNFLDGKGSQLVLLSCWRGLGAFSPQGGCILPHQEKCGHALEEQQKKFHSHNTTYSSEGHRYFSVCRTVGTKAEQPWHDGNCLFEGSMAGGPKPSLVFHCPALPGLSLGESSAALKWNLTCTLLVQTNSEYKWLIISLLCFAC